MNDRWGESAIQARMSFGPRGERLLVAKVTFALAPERMYVVEPGEAIVERDVIETKSGRQLVRPSDLVHEGSRPEVIATGRVHASRSNGPQLVRVFAGGGEESREIPEAAFDATIVLRARVDALVLSAPIVVEGLHPQMAYFGTRLPTVRPTADAFGPRGSRGVRFLPKLLVLDLERLTGAVTWVGSIPEEAEDTQLRLSDEAEPEVDERAHTMEISVKPFETGLPFSGSGQPQAGPGEIRLPNASQRKPSGQLQAQAQPVAQQPVAQQPIAQQPLTAQPRQPLMQPAVPTQLPQRGQPGRTPSGGLGPLLGVDGRPRDGQPALPTYLQVQREDDTSPVPPPPARELAAAAQVGAVAVSDAAAGDRPAPAPSKVSAATIDAPTVPVRLTWHDPAELATVCRHAPWVRLAPPPPPPPEPPPPPKRGQPPAPPPPPPPAEDEALRVKRHLVAILQSAEPERRPRAHAHAPLEGGAAPLVLVDGVLQLPFDDALELKATAELAGQTAPSDQKRLKELVDYANDLVKLPTQASPSFVRQVLGQLHEAWEKSPRSLPSGFLQKNVERGLLEQRAYCKRTVFGAPHLRAYVTTDEGDVPVYLPESVADSLPLLTSFRVRLIAEAHPAEDGLESSPVALLARALGRVAEARSGSRADGRGA